MVRLRSPGCGKSGDRVMAVKRLRLSPSSPLRRMSCARHCTAPPHVVDFAGRVSIGIDAEHASQLQRAGAPAPVDIETPGIRVDFNRNAVLRAGAQDRVHIDFVARSPEELSASDMPQ